jgi:hypothetical protein
VYRSVIDVILGTTPHTGDVTTRLREELFLKAKQNFGSRVVDDDPYAV